MQGDNIQHTTYVHANIETTRLNWPRGQGAHELDQQWINSGSKQCSRHPNKTFVLPISLFLDETKQTLIRFTKKHCPFHFLEMKPLMMPYLTIVYNVLVAPMGAYIDVHSSVANTSSGQIFITSIQISLIIFFYFSFKAFKNV